MAHFALLNKNNEVVRVEVVDNKNCLDENGQESEEVGVQFLRNIYNDQSLRYKQTSYNKTIRKNYAGVGYVYDEDRDAFIAPKPDAPVADIVLIEGEHVLNESTCEWEYTGKIDVSVCLPKDK